MQFFLKLVRHLIWRCLNFIVGARRHLFRWKAFGTAWYFRGQLVLPNTCRIAVPITITGKGRVEVGEGVGLGFGKAPKLGNGAILLQARESKARIVIGSKTITSNNISIVANQLIEIGEGCQLGDLVSIYDSDFHEINPLTRNESSGVCSPVVIGKNVWLGSRVIVLKGVQIGNDSVIAAGSVVTKSIPARCLAAGIPARVIREI